MKKSEFFIYMLVATIFATTAVSCKKYLDAKPDSKLVIPTSVADLQALLDDVQVMNLRRSATAEASADDYYLSYNDWAAIPDEGQRNMYIWGPELVFTNTTNDWARTFDVVYRANLVLEYIDAFTRTAVNKTEAENLKGAAHFYRAFSFLNAVGTWAKAYDKSTAAADLGIPLRLNSNFNETSTRASVQQTYDQVIEDCKAAITLLPLTSAHVMRPSKPAAYGLLARTFLWMREYDKAKLYADSCLSLYNTLLNFSTLNVNANYPIARFGREVIFHALIPPNNNIHNSLCRIDSNLYRSYTDIDLRRKAFFRTNADGSVGFKGSFDGSASLFDGIATGELILTRAECETRAGHLTEAMKDLNALRQSRSVNPATYTPVFITDAQQALDTVLLERRKELLMRGLRWMDIKRLNLEGKNISLKRRLNNDIFELKPNDPKFALPLPQVIIQLSRMPQNPR